MFGVLDVFVQEGAYQSLAFVGGVVGEELEVLFGGWQ